MCPIFHKPFFYIPWNRKNQTYLYNEILKIFFTLIRATDAILEPYNFSHKVWKEDQNWLNLSSLGWYISLMSRPALKIPGQAYYSQITLLHSFVV